jgi:hypothetical protein
LVLYLPACIGNNPDSTKSKDATCALSLAMCSATPAPDDLMYWRFEALAGPPRGTWTQAGSVCLRASQAPSGAVPAFTVREFQRLPLPAGTVHVQPPGGRTLVNVPTNVFVSAGPVTLATRLLGLAVRVRATPVSYRWTFGDGAVLETSASGCAPATAGSTPWPAARGCRSTGWHSWAPRRWPFRSSRPTPSWSPTPSTPDQGGMGR